MKRTFFLFLLLSCLSVVEAQRDLRFRVMEYNCENLFDTVHDYSKEDLNFTPEGEYAWGTRRYWKKQGDLARVILDAGGLQPVDLIGLCEVENDSVITHLIRRTRLAALGYEYAMTDCRDIRGIDVALLYQPYTFRLIEKENYSVLYNAEKERPTRDILRCSGVVPTGDTLDVMVVHFPSRRGGASLTDAYRCRAAEVVCRVADSLRQVRRNPAILVMGDCNDEPHDRSLRMIEKVGFRNLSAAAKAKGNGGNQKKLRTISGTYYYQKEWSRIDNILLSQDAVERFKASGAFIFAPDYLLEPDSDGFPMPFRIYRGPGYHGGVSDHLPLVLDLWY